MTDRQLGYLDQVRRIVAGYVAAGTGRVFLFGSWARDEIREASDIDLAVDPGAGLSEARLAELGEALEESTVPYRVDLVNLAHADVGFRSRVASEGIPWIG